MMILRSIVLALFLPSAAFADSALVRSGDHDTFSRLVIYARDIDDWEVVRSDKEVLLSSKTWTGGFDVRSIFQKISRGRISDVVAGTSDLRLELACDCSIEIQDVDSIGILLDVIDPPQDELPNFSVLERTDSVRNVFELGFAKESDPKRSRKSPVRRQDKENLQAGFAPSEEQVAFKSSVDPGILGGRFGENGRLRLSDPLEQLEVPSPKVKASEDRQCPDEAHSEISEWSNNNDLLTQLGRLRRELISNSGEVNETAALGIAQVQAAFGLFPEARQTVMSLELAGPEIDVFHSILGILEGTRASETPFDLKNGLCTGDNRVLQILSSDESVSVGKEEVSDIYTTFLAWPKTLRELLIDRFTKTALSSHPAFSDALNRVAYSRDDIPEKPSETRDTSSILGLPSQMLNPDFLARLEQELEDWALGRRPMKDVETEILQSIMFQLKSDEVSNLIGRAFRKNDILSGNYREAISGLNRKETQDMVSYIIQAENDFNVAQAEILSRLLIEVDKEKYLTPPQREIIEAKLRQFSDLETRLPPRQIIDSSTATLDTPVSETSSADNSLGALSDIQRSAQIALKESSALRDQIKAELNLP